MDSHDIEIVLLGGFGVVVDGRPVPSDGWRRRHAAALVKLLALTPRRRLHREQVVDALWPDLDVEAAAPRLHKAAHYARRAIGRTESIVLAGDVVQLLPGADVAVDIARFQAAAEAALAARDPESASRAADLYTGDLLPEDPYEPWAEQARDSLRLLHLEVLRLAGRWEAVAQADPADEEAHLAVARSLAAAGDRRAALRQLERLERALRTELGVGPGRPVLELRQALMALGGHASGPAETDVNLVGRDDALARADQLLTAAQEGRGRVLLVSGPAGIGKTSFLAAVEAMAAARRMRVGTGVAARVEGAWPFAPVLEALADLCRRHLALLDGLDDAMREEIERALSGRRVSWDGQGSHQRLFVASAELLRLAAAGAGAVLVIDDAHQADEASLRLAHFLARSTLTEKVLVVVGHRPVATGVLADVRGSLVGRGSATTLDLRPLAPQDAAELVRRHAPDADATVVAAVAQAARGLPLAVVETARAVAADPGAPVHRALLPPGLDDHLVRFVTSAAVLGVSFDTDEFAELTGLSDDDTYRLLEEGVAAGLLRRTDAGFRFGHPLLREALLEAAGADGRRRAHRAAATALQRLHGSPARIAHHLVQAGQQVAAVPWVLQVADTEASLGAYRDALATLDTIRAHATGEEREQVLALRADLLTACGDLSALDAFREALSVVREPSRRRRLRIRLARAATFAGDLQTTEAALDQLALDGGRDDGALLLARGNLAFFQRDFPAADAAAAEARRLLALGASAEWQLFELVTLQGLLAHYRGEWFQKLRAELRTGAERPDLAVNIFDSHLCVAECLLYGPTPYDEVARLAGDLRRTATAAGVLRAVAFAVALQGEAALLAGDLDAAEATLLEAADLHHDLESPAGEAHCLQRLAEVHLHRGEPDAARPLLQRALPLARWSVLTSCLLPRVFGSMVVAAPDAEAARAVVDRAESASGPQDHCPFCRIMFAVPAAVACADVGDLDDARRFLSVAEGSEAMWEGTAWEASLVEARAHLEAAEGHPDGARNLLQAAADLFEASGQPLDAARCRAALEQGLSPTLAAQ